MLNFQKIANKPNLVRSFTGFPKKTFNRLIPTFSRAYNNDLEKKDQCREHPRKRRRGGGRKSVLKTNIDQLLFILFYFKFYPTQDVIAFFGFSQAEYLRFNLFTPVVI